MDSTNGCSYCMCPQKVIEYSDLLLVASSSVALKIHFESLIPWDNWLINQITRSTQTHWNSWNQVWWPYNTWRGSKFIHSDPPNLQAWAWAQDVCMTRERKRLKRKKEKKGKRCHEDVMLIIIVLFSIGKWKKRTVLCLHVDMWTHNYGINQSNGIGARQLTSLCLSRTIKVRWLLVFNEMISMRVLSLEFRNIKIV